MNLQSLNVQEMNASEMVEVEGGLFIQIAIVVCILAGTFMAN